MDRPGLFDWFHLSKLNDKNFSNQEFSTLIKHAHFGQQISRVPVSLRQKLLLAFQTASASIKEKYQQERQSINKLNLDKNAMNHNICAIKQQLEGSMQKINGDRVLIEEKRKFLDKLKQKIKNKQAKKKSPTQTYFCPLCTRENFTSRNQFSLHLMRDHANNFNENKSNGNESGVQASIPTEVKQLILSLKDKQIQLMEMMLNKKKQMEILELEQKFEHQIRKMKTQANFMQRKSAYTTEIDRKFRTQEDSEDISQELKGQSQYLFYKPQSEPYQGMFRQQLENERRANLSYNFYENLPDQNPNQRPYLKYPSQLGSNTAAQVQVPEAQRNYYNIFSQDVALSQVDHNLSPKKAQQFDHVKLQGRGNVPKTSSAINKQTQVQAAKFASQKPSTISNNSSINQKSHSQIKPLQAQNLFYTQSKLYSYNQNGRSVNQKRQGTQSRQNVKHESVYAESKSKLNSISQSSHSNSNSILSIKGASKLSQAHIFNSGPLMDDLGGDSDFEDYFGRNKQKSNKPQSNVINRGNEEQDEVIDEQIVAVKPQSIQRKQLNIRFNAPQAHIQILDGSGRQNGSLQSSQANHSNVMLEYSKDKSFLDVSQSKQKSSDLIQLSNSFSKRGLQESKSNQTINLSDLKFSKLERQKNKRQQKERQSQFRNQSHKIDLTEFQQQIHIPTYQDQIYLNDYQSNSNLLEQFKMPEQVAFVKPERAGIKKTEKPYIREAKQIKMPVGIDLQKTNPGVLQQFLFRQQE